MSHWVSVTLSGREPFSQCLHEALADLSLQSSRRPGLGGLAGGVVPFLPLPFRRHRCLALNRTFTEPGTDAEIREGGVCTWLAHQRLVLGGESSVPTCNLSAEEGGRA